jgi:hypothetical protein
MTTKLKLGCLLILGLSLLAPLATQAKEGADQYGYGSETFFSGVLPPPGTYYINYFNYYHGDLRNGSGDKVSIAGTTPSVDAEVEVLRFVHVTPLKIFGANYTIHTLIPLVQQSVDLGGSNSRFGIGDIVIDPLILGWHHKNLHLVEAFDICLPTGHYDKNDARVSLGAHYWSFEPVLDLTYMSPHKFEVSSKLIFTLRTTNSSTNYKSGNEFHTDFVVGKNIKNWALGPAGYFAEQLNNDSINGQEVAAIPGVYSAGREMQLVGLGPAVRYFSPKSHILLEAKYYQEFAVRNHFGGERFQFKLVVPMSSLLPKKG